MGSKQNPGAFDCFANALADEPMFILLARDTSAPDLVMAWAQRRACEIEDGKRPESDMRMVEEAIVCAGNMDAWRIENWPRRKGEKDEGPVVRISMEFSGLTELLNHWRFHAIWHRCKATGRDPDNVEHYKAAEAEIEKARVEENRKRQAHAEPPRDIGS